MCDSSVEYIAPEKPKSFEEDPPRQVRRQNNKHGGRRRVSNRSSLSLGGFVNDNKTAGNTN